MQELGTVHPGTVARMPAAAGPPPFDAPTSASSQAPATDTIVQAVGTSHAHSSCS